MRIAQTNLSINQDNKILDHQTLVYEVGMSFEEFAEEFKSGREIKVKNSTMPGRIRKGNEQIEIVHQDRFHMHINWEDNQKSLFYAIDDYTRY